ncbi:MAG: ribonuclease H-like domain-containing protein [Planctomycetota bacterium]
MRDTDLGRKLRRAFKLGPVPVPALRGSLQKRHARSERWLRERGVALPAGDEAANAAGRFYLRTLRYRGDTVHGTSALGQVWDLDQKRIAGLARDDDFENLDPDACLFLDTETTGLAGGAGTVVFLCGLGFCEGDTVVVEQVFLRSFADEPGALHHVAARLERYPTLVTYVGKSFDRHRLQARMAVNKVSCPILEARHLDLYYLARRAFGAGLPDVRLQTVEREVLGFHREDDFPGAEAPTAFLRWIQDGSGQVDRVFEHNRLDVLSLVSLLGALGRAGTSTV